MEMENTNNIKWLNRASFQTHRKGSDVDLNSENKFNCEFQKQIQLYA